MKDLLFQRFVLRAWRQFSRVELDLSSRVTILTGINGSGKTTILRLLSAVLGSLPEQFSATPIHSSTGGITWVASIDYNYIEDEPNDGSQVKIGEFELSDGTVTDIKTQQYHSNSSYTPVIILRDRPSGIYISSHRPKYEYTQLTSINLQPNNMNAVHSAYISTLINRHVSNAALQLKYALVTWAQLGYGNAASQPLPELVRHFEDFQQVMKLLLPEELGFERLQLRSGSEVVFITRSGEFLLEEMSGGLGSMIHLAWLIFTYPVERAKITVLIDEIENHLHPSLQRTVLNKLSFAFPDVKFIVTTHSPLVVTSVKDARIYALSHGEDRKIYSTQLDFSNDAKNATEILDIVLGVPTTLPQWAESKYEEILERYISKPVDQIDLKAFRNELIENGLGNLVLTGVDRILTEKQ